MNTATTSVTLFERLCNSHRADFEAINANPHADAIEYLIQNPEYRDLLKLLNYNANQSAVLDMMFRLGIFYKESGAKIQSDCYCFTETLTEWKTVPHKFHDNGKKHVPLESEEIWFHIWCFLFRNPSPDALRILRANEAEIEEFMGMAGQWHNETAIVEIAKNTNPEIMEYLYGRIGAGKIAPWFHDVENFWTEIFQNETPNAMQFFRENIIGFYNAFFDCNKGQLTFKIKDVTLLSRAFFDFLDDIEFNRTWTIDPYSNEFNIQEDFLLYFYGSVCLGDLGYNKHAANFILKRQEPTNCLKIDYNVFSANSSREAVKHLIESPSKIVWEVFCESNTHNDAIQYMSENRGKIDMLCIVKNENPWAIEILSEMLEHQPPPKNAHFWRLLAQNPAPEAVKIIDAHFATAVSAAGLKQIAESLLFNINPRVLDVLEKHGDVLKFWDIGINHDEEIAEYICENPMLFENRISNEYEYVLK